MNVNFKNEEMQIVVHKSMEIYETIKNCILKVENKRLNSDDMKYLALLLGITNTNNEVRKILKLLKWDYGINVFSIKKSQEECNEILKNNFLEIFKQNNISDDKTVPYLMLKLLDNKTIKELHYSLGLSIVSIKLVLCNIIKESEEKCLQKKKTMIL